MVQSSMRAAIARQMALSKKSIPHYYLTARADVTEALARREAVNADRPSEARVSVNDLIVRAVALGLEQHRQFNGHYVDGAFHGEDRINVGVAIALTDGLLAPAILDCQSLSLDEISGRSKDLVSRARQGRLRAAEYASATFTVTNLGMYAVDSFTAIIVPPQVAILAVGTASLVPVLREGTWVPSRELTLTLSADHRVTDGAEGARFLESIVSDLKQPDRLFQ
jgi:pyruvate dehydrogenase E2 component (dihydrolipoamide acetyltransferase)